MTSNHDALTTEEVANLLKVSKLTVYDLIKKGVLPSYRVGRQIRVERNALEDYKRRGSSYKKENSTEVIENKLNKSSVIITGQDQCLDILAKQLENKNAKYQPLRSHIGSLNGLISMYHEKADIVSTHLYDGDTNTYNIPYIRKILVSHSIIVIHLLKRNTGFFVQKNNPKNIHSWNCLHDPHIKFVNREQGSGARILLDEKLKLQGIKPSQIQGYSNEFTSHIDIANSVANKRADIGVGSRQTANMIDVDYVPMVDESYDLVMLSKNSALIETVRTILEDNTFKNTLENMGFNTKETGKVLYEQF